MTNKDDGISENPLAIAKKRVLDRILTEVMPDYDYWWKMECWTLEEACLLLLGIDPRMGTEIMDDGNIQKLLVERDNLMPFDQSLEPPIAESVAGIFCMRWAHDTLNKYNKIKGLSERASCLGHKAFINDGTCEQLVFPSEFIIWVVEKGYDIPKPFVELIHNDRNQPVHVPFLDREHPDFPEELEMAIAAWTALYQNGEIRRNRGSKQQIMTWLKERYPRASQSALKRVTTIVNPNKKGGAPSTN